MFECTWRNPGVRKHFDFLRDLEEDQIVAPLIVVSDALLQEQLAKKM
jgi:hypothetical protein